MKVNQLLASISKDQNASAHDRGEDRNCQFIEIQHILWYGTTRDFNDSHPDRPIVQSTVSRILTTFNETGSVHRKQRDTEYALINSNHLIEAVKAYFQANPMDSINGAARQFQVSYV